MPDYLVSIRTNSMHVITVLETFEILGLLEVRTIMNEETGEVE